MIFKYFHIENSKTREVESPCVGRSRARTISFDVMNNQEGRSHGLRTPIHNTPLRCSTPPTVSPSKSRFIEAPEVNLRFNNPFNNYFDKMIKNSIDENMGTSNADNHDPSGQEILDSITKLNEGMLEKEQNLVSIKLQLKILENNINIQVEDFIQSLAVSHDNLHTRFLEVKQNNDELKRIKDYILSCKLNSNKFTYKHILSRLGIKSIEEVYDTSAIKRTNEVEKSVTASLRLDQQRSEVFEEDKYTIGDDDILSQRRLMASHSHAGRGNTQVAANKNPSSEFGNMDHSGFKRTSKPIKIESLELPTNKRDDHISKMKKLESFEDESFNFGPIKDNTNTFSVPENKDPSRKRATSNSLLESIAKQAMPNSNNLNNPQKRFKENETSTVDNSKSLPLNQHLGVVPNASSLPFMSNIQLDPETICQMLIRKLAANGGLNNLNDIFRILPDNILGRGRSNTD
jgi:hypothetical protein